MKVTYKKDINHTYVVFEGGAIDTNNFQTQMLLHNMAEGLLPCTILRMDQKELWQCECTGLQSLETYCKMHEIGKEDFVWIMNQILENIQELQDFLLNADNLYLMPGEIYLHPEKGKLLCCMTPVYRNDVLDSLKGILQFLLQYLSPEDQEVARIVYGFFRTLGKEDCTLADLWSHLYEKKKNCGQLSEDTGEKKKRESVSFEDVTDDRDRLLEELFFDKKEEPADWKEKIKNTKISFDYIKKAAYIFPALAAVLLFLYLAFNSWTMSGIELLGFAAVIVALQIFSIYCYRKWGREIKERNPIFEEEPESEDPGTVLLREPETKRYLLVRSDTKEQYLLDQKEMIIGKHTEKAQILLTDPVVSRIHAKVMIKNQGIYIQDMNSKNGTYVNEKRLNESEEILLTYKDSLSIANIQFFLQK